MVTVDIITSSFMAFVQILNKMPLLAFTRDAEADSFIPIVCFADL